MNRKLFFFNVVVLFVLFLAVWGCEGDVSTVSEDPYGPVEEAAVSFGVKWPDASREQDGRSMTSSLTNMSAECAARGVDKVRVEVKGQSGASLKSATFDCAAGQGSLTGIEPQSGCAIMISSLNDSGAAIYKGQKTGVTLHAGMNNVGVVQLARIDAPPPDPGGAGDPGVMPPGDISNAIGMTFNYIEPGTFMMGSPEDELDRGSEEYQHQVTLTQGFYMQTTPVTQGQWKKVMESNPSYYSNCGNDCPVDMVSWNDVQDFISVLNALEGTNRYAFPTEAQWEYAARAGSKTAFPNGKIARYADMGECNYDANLDAIGWYCYNSQVDYSPNTYGRGTHPVAQKEPNAWGLYDMHGNVWEWVADWRGTYPSSAVVDPTGPVSGTHRMLRGGSWFDVAGDCRSAVRSDGYDPSYRGSVGNGGFRLVLLSGH